MSNNQIMSYAGEYRKQKAGRERRMTLSILIGLTFVLAVAAAFSLILKQNAEMQRLQIVKRELMHEMELVQLEQKEIQDLNALVGTDEFIERIARDELGLAKPDEFVFVE